MQKPSERHKLTSDNNIIKFKKPVHDPYKYIITKRRYLKKKRSRSMAIPTFHLLGIHMCVCIY